MTNVPLRTIQPIAVPAQFFVWGPILAGFLAIFPGFITFAISNVIDHNRPSPIVGYGLLAYGFFFLLFLTLLGLRSFQGPAKTFYRIHRDHIEIEEGLFNRRRRTILVGDVIDVAVTEGVLQRTRGVGTITLISRPLTIDSSESLPAQRTISLANVPQPGDVYDLIRSLALGGAKLPGDSREN